MTSVTAGMMDQYNYTTYTCVISASSYARRRAGNLMTPSRPFFPVLLLFP